VVIGVKDTIRDEAIKAFIVLHEGETLSADEFFLFAHIIWRNLKCRRLLNSGAICHATVQGKSSKKFNITYLAEFMFAEIEIT
jgi:crotonobetaine/carnitine-CoA ligase